MQYQQTFALVRDAYSSFGNRNYMYDMFLRSFTIFSNIVMSHTVLLNPQRGWEFPGAVHQFQGYNVSLFQMKHRTQQPQK
jgi:hypothetical protein